METSRPLAVVTGASSGIGLELALQCASNGFDLVIASDRSQAEAEREIRARGARVRSIIADLGTEEGVEQLVGAIGGARVDALLANAGQGLGKAFLDQDFEALRHIVDTNITGTLALIHRIGRTMRDQGAGRILITGSIAGFMPGTFQAVYNGTKAFVDSFTEALRNEIKDSDGVTLTTLMPGPVDTEFFARGDMLDTSVGADPNKRDAADVAKDGWDALMSGKASIFSGWKTKVQGVLANVTPGSVLAEQHRKMAEPGSAED